LHWTGSVLEILEQKDLPLDVRHLSCSTVAQTARAIREMSVRGAPAIAIAASYGLVLAARSRTYRQFPALVEHLENSSKALAATRPTAVNLFWALERMKAVWQSFLPVAGAGFQEALAAALEREADAIFEEDEASCRRMGEFGAALLPAGARVFTHCNTGALATAGHGTALGVIRSAWEAGRLSSVYVDETRPYLQGGRLTAWELSREKIPYEIVCEGMAAHLMKTETVHAVLVGADRIAANGDTANKIGTYSLAVLARHHGIPFHVVAPRTSIDFSLSSGAVIPIEERSAEEVLSLRGIRIAPKGAKARNPAFDVTPAGLITSIVTDRGVFAPGELGAIR
jgi:methylthioribose-1-phosphate isomerase